MGSLPLPIPRRIPTLPSTLRSGGFLFLLATISVAGGSPWFDRLGLDPAWLAQCGPDSVADPVSGLAIRSSSDLALRTPLRTSWSRTEIVQTFSGTLVVDSLRWTNWARTSLARTHHEVSTTDFALGGGTEQAGWSGGTLMSYQHFRTAIAFQQETGRHGIAGSVVFGGPRARLEAGAARTWNRSALEISTTQGDLSMGWNDDVDSSGASVRIPLGRAVLSARAWVRESASRGAPDLTDSGTATGWSLDASVPTGFGIWSVGIQRDRADLRTLGANEGRVFHDQDWRAVRVGIDASWKGGAWNLRGSTRQARLDLPYGGLDRPFVHWNMIPSDAFGRIAGVLEDKSEFLDGSFRVQSWNLDLERAIAWKSISVMPGLGASWTGFDALLERSTLEIRGLFPSVEESIPCDGSGWFAMANAHLGLEWKTTSLGTLRADGTWRQPFAGRWNSRQANAPSATAPSAAGKNAADPLGFHSWSLDWMLAL